MMHLCFISLHRLVIPGFSVTSLMWLSEEFLRQKYMATLIYVSELIGVMKSVHVFKSLQITSLFFFLVFKGNAMGYVRMIRSGGLHCCSSAIRYLKEILPFSVCSFLFFCSLFMLIFPRFLQSPINFEKVSFYAFIKVILSKPVLEFRTVLPLP